MVSGIGLAIYRKKYTNICFFESGAPEKLKNLQSFSYA
jgi:hypothetical protein